MKVTLIRPTYVAGKLIREGEESDLDTRKAKDLVDTGRAVTVIENTVTEESQNGDCSWQ